MHSRTLASTLFVLLGALSTVEAQLDHHGGLIPRHHRPHDRFVLRSHDLEERKEAEKRKEKSKPKKRTTAKKTTKKSSTKKTTMHSSTKKSTTTKKSSTTTKPTTTTKSSSTSKSSTITTTTTSSTAPQQTNPFSSIVVWGSSYCDNGHTRPAAYSSSLKPPPYVGGRWSNGPMWAEYLANGLLGSTIPLYDYAYGGAQANNDLTYGSVPDTRNQTNTYISDVTDDKVARGQGSVLHMLWIGINPITQIWTDAINAGFTDAAQTKASARVDAEVQEVVNQIMTIKVSPAVNAVPSDFLLLPIPPLEIVPTFIYQAQDLANGNSAKAATYLSCIATLTQQYNDGLTNAVSGFGQQSQTSGWLRTFDVVSFWRKVKASPSSFGLTNVADTCLNSSTGKVCSTPSTYEYWDSLHPTTAMHKIFAQQLLATLQQTGA